MKISNFEFGEVLRREQLKTITGGAGGVDVGLDPGTTMLDTRCKVLLADGSGGVLNFIGATTGAQVSAAANAWCVNAVINDGAGSCKYDCYHDGQG